MCKQKTFKILIRTNGIDLRNRRIFLFSCDYASAYHLFLIKKCMKTIFCTLKVGS